MVDLIFVSPVWVGLPFPLQEYACHDTYGESFRKVLDSIQKEFGEEPAEPALVGGDGTEGNKRPQPSGAARGGPRKKIKMDESKLIPIADLGDSGKLVDIPLLNLKQPSVNLRLMTGGKVYLINSGAQEVSIKAGIILCGYGRGAFKASQSGDTSDIDPAKEVLFDMKTGADMVPRLQRIMWFWAFGHLVKA